MRKFCKLFLIIGLFLCSSLLFTGCDDDLILVTGVDLYKEEVYANLNDTIDLSYKVYPNNASNQKVMFWSTDDSVASVDEVGKVTIKAYGEASIVIRSLDGGYEDTCKIITNVDPDGLRWDTSDGKLTSVTGETYSATSAMALNQVMKLKLDYLLNNEESDIVTNKNVKFTSSNTSNIIVINEAEGIIKAVNNEKIDGNQAYSDITATVETKEGNLSLTCRVYINEFSSLNHLYLNYKNYNTQVLDLRNGSETIYLTTGGSAVEFYAYITNMSNDVKTDYTMNIVSSNTNIFTVDNLTYNNGWYFFKLTPSMINEDTGTLYITTTCSDESGKTIRCSVNVTVQAEIESAKASATDRNDGLGTEILLNGEIFSLDLDFFDIGGNEIEGASRQIYFNELSGEILNYISDYGNNRFKVKAVPTDLNKKFEITGYFYVENVETSTQKEFTYSFYLRNNLEGIIVTEEPKSGAIPNFGTSSITIPVGGIKNLFAYATSYDFNDTEPTLVSAYETEGLATITKSSNNNFTVFAGNSQGTTTINFVATDGKITIEYEVTVNIVAKVAKINFYSDYSSGSYDGLYNLEAIVTGTTARIYFDIVSVDPNYSIESSSSIKVSITQGTLKEYYDSAHNKVVRYIEIDLSSYSAGDSFVLTVTANRILASSSITIEVS